MMSALSNSEIPHMSRPFLEVEEIGRVLAISQTPLICRFLAERHGLMSEDIQEALAAEALVLTCFDLTNEAHNTHHPVAVSKYYEEQKAEALTAAQELTSNRLPKYIGKITTAVQAGRKRASGTSPFAFGGKLSYCDIVLFHALKGVEFAFPDAYSQSTKDNSTLKDLLVAVEKVHSLREYLDSPRRMPFNSNGVFRFYPELQ